MARLERTDSGRCLVAENECELDLLRDGSRRGGLVVLLSGYYPVNGRSVLLPENLSARGVERVRHALERAALAHHEAQRRRRSFRLVRA